jgi:hypothetical protein
MNPARTRATYEERSDGDHPSDKIWSIYCSEAEKDDDAWIKGVVDDMDVILVFVSEALTVSSKIVSQDLKQDWPFLCRRNGVHH